MRVFLDTTCTKCTFSKLVQLMPAPLYYVYIINYLWKWGCNMNSFVIERNFIDWNFILYWFDWCCLNNWLLIWDCFCDNRNLHLFLNYGVLLCGCMRVWAGVRACGWVCGCMWVFGSFWCAREILWISGFSMHLHNSRMWIWSTNRWYNSKHRQCDVCNIQMMNSCDIRNRNTIN